MKPTTMKFQHYGEGLSQFAVVVLNGRRERMYHGEDDEVVIPPQLLGLEVSTEQAKGHGCHLQNGHGRNHRHGPWLESIRVVSLEPGQD